MVLVLASAGPVQEELLLWPQAAWAPAITEAADSGLNSCLTADRPVAQRAARAGGMRAIADVLPQVLARYGLGAAFSGQLESEPAE